MAKSPAVILYDANGVAMAVEDGVAIPANTRALIAAGKEGSNSRFMRVASDGTVRVDPTGTTVQPISASSLPLPAGAASSANQATIIGHIDGLETLNANIQAVLEAIRDTAGIKKITDALPAGNNNIGDVDVASSALPTGAATLAEQQTQTTALQLIDDVVHATNGALSKVAAIGGQMDDASITDATENNVAPVRITSKRALHAAIHDAVGNAISSILDSGVRRFQVEAAIAPGQSVSIGTPLPEDPTNLTRDFVKNAGSPNLLVNGSVTPVNFDFLKDGTDDIKVGELRFVMVADTVLIQGDKFGPINTLTNGLRIQVTSNDVTTDLANLLLTEDFLTFPNPQLFFDRGGPKEVMAVSFSLGGAVKLLAASSADKIRVTVRDNLTDVKFKYFRCTVSGVKV